MRCRHAQLWLLTTRPGAPRPATLRRHLQRCARCRRHDADLSTLDRRVRSLPVPPGDPDGPARCKEALARLPQQAPAPAAKPRRPWSAVRWIAWPAAAAILVALGGFVGRMTGPPAAAKAKIEPSPIAPVAAVVALKPRLRTDAVVCVLDQDLRLAGGGTAPEQIQALDQVGAALHAEALALAREGLLDQLPAAVALYDRVLRHGLLGRARPLRPEERPAVLAGILPQLKDAQAQARAAADGAPPAVSELLKHVADTAAETAGLLEKGSFPPLSASAPPAEGQPLLAILVWHGLRLGESPTPIQRAEVCSDLAHHLSQSIVLLAAAGDNDPVGPLGERLEQLMQAGVADNLDRAAQADPQGKQAERRDRVWQKAGLAAALVQRNVPDAAVAAGPGLQKALEIAAKGQKEKPGSFLAPLKKGAGTPEPGKDKTKTDVPPGPKKSGLLIPGGQSSAAPIWFEGPGNREVVAFLDQLPISFRALPKTL
jgi:hypothetical protein